MTRLALLALPLALIACTSNLSDDTYRIAAAEVVRPVIFTGLPRPVADAVTACILAPASRDELIALAQGLVLPPSAATRARVADLLARPEVTDCLTRNALPIPQV